MKKKLIPALLAAALTLALLVPAFAYTEYGLIYDATDKLDPEFCDSMGFDTLYTFRQHNGVELRVDVVDDLEGESIEDYARSFYDQYEYGYPGTGDGYLMMLYLTEDATGLVYHDSCVICGGEDQEQLAGLMASLEPALAQWLNEAVWSGDLNQDNLAFQCAVELYVALAEDYLTGGQSGGVSEGEPAAETEPGAPDIYTEGLMTPCVQDAAGLLTAQECGELEQQAREIGNQYQCGVYITILDDYQNYASTIRDCAKEIYKQLDLGYGSGKDGVMLTLSMADRDYWLLTYGDVGNTAFTDYGKDKLAEEFLDNFSNDDWYGGFTDYLDACAAYLQAARDGTPVDVDSDSEPTPMGTRILMSYGIALLVGIGIALSVCLVLKSGMKTAVAAVRAEEYVPNGGVDIRVREDHFVNTTVTRRKIEKESGGTTIDRDGFSGSGGKF